jgi:hypothetical protein
MEFFKNIDLSFAQVDCIARGLHAIAAADGVHSREEAFIREFYEACRTPGAPPYHDAIQRRFDITEAMEFLATGELRRLFVKTAWLLAFADRKVTQPERDKIAEFAKTLGVKPEESTELQAQVKEFLLAQLAHVRNSDALAQIAREMKVL